MKLNFSGSILTVTREENDPKYYGVVNAAGESKLLHAIKKELNKQGYDLVKKRMAKDGHLVDDMQQYLRTRKKGAGGAIFTFIQVFGLLRGQTKDLTGGKCPLM